MLRQDIAQKTVGFSDFRRMHRELAKNEAELSALKFAGSGFDAVLGQVIEALHNAESLIRPLSVSLRLDSMNVVAGPEVADASTVERRVDFDAMLQAL